MAFSLSPFHCDRWEGDQLKGPRSSLPFSPDLSPVPDLELSAIPREEESDFRYLCLLRNVISSDVSVSDWKRV